MKVWKYVMLAVCLVLTAYDGYLIWFAIGHN